MNFTNILSPITDDSLKSVDFFFKLWSTWTFKVSPPLHPLLVHVVVEWPLSETSMLTSTFYLVCQRNISFSEKPWDNYKILVFWVHIFQSRRGYLVSTFFALIIQVSNALSTVPLWITNFCLCIHVTQRVAGRFRPGLKLLCKTRYRLLHHFGTIISEGTTKSSLSN